MTAKQYLKKHPAVQTLVDNVVKAAKRDGLDAAATIKDLQSKFKARFKANLTEEIATEFLIA